MRDAIELLAVAAIGYGLWMIYPPSALVCIGALVLAASVKGRRPND